MVKITIVALMLAALMSPVPAGAAEPAAAVPAVASPAKLDVNVATTAELEGVPGIGPSTAQAIVDLRRTRGQYRALDELLEVKGIGEKKIVALSAYLTVKSPAATAPQQGAAPTR